VSSLAHTSLWLARNNLCHISCNSPDALVGCHIQLCRSVSSLLRSRRRRGQVERDLKGLVFQEQRRSQGSSDATRVEGSRRVGQKLHEDRGISPAIVRLTLNPEVEVWDTHQIMWGRLSSLPVRRTFQSGLGRLESRPNWQTRMSAPRQQFSGIGGQHRNSGYQRDFKPQAGARNGYGCGSPDGHPRFPNG
jgi:hypothetical protein